MRIQGAEIMRVLVVVLFVLMNCPAGAEENKSPSREEKNKGTMGEKSQPTDVVAVVNETVITNDALERELEMVKRQYESMGSPLFDAQLPEIKARVGEVLIDRELLYQESQKKKIVVDEKEVQERFQEWKGQYPSDDLEKSALAAINHTEESLKKDIRKLMAIEKFIDQQFKGKVAVTEEEVKSFYDSHPNFFQKPEQVRASHILIKLDPNADPAKKEEARKKLEEAKKKLAQGGDFAALAKELSECPSSAQGGDLGFFHRGMMVKPFEDVAFALEPNNVSDIVETQFGYHLIKVTEKQPAGTVSLEESRDKIEEYLKGQKIGEEVKKCVAALKEKAIIKRTMVGAPSPTEGPE